MNSMNPKVDWFFSKAGKWKKEFELLRTIVLDCDLIEELKWGQPCYVFEKTNIVLIHGFKEYCALLFFKGCQRYSGPANRECSGGPSDPVYQRSGNSEDESHLEEVYL